MPNLDTFHNRSLDGLHFCTQVYDLFGEVKGSDNGLARIRLRQDETAKRLMEELIPIARYTQSRYEASNRFHVRWINGSQPYDAILYFSGDWVEKAGHPSEIHLEVTTSVHGVEYLAREQLHEQGMTFGPNLIARDAKSRTITSQPFVYSNNQRCEELALQIISRVRAKEKKGQ